MAPSSLSTVNYIWKIVSIFKGYDTAHGGWRQKANFLRCGAILVNYLFSAGLKSRYRLFALRGCRRAPGRLQRGAAGAPAACRPVPTSRRPLQPLVAWRRRTTGCRLRPTQLEQRRRMAGRTSPGARAAAPGRSGELAGRLGKLSVRLQPRRSSCSELLDGCRRMAGWTAGGLCRDPELWCGKSGTEDVLWSWRCRKGLAVLASFVCDRRYMQLGTPCWCTTAMYRVDHVLNQTKHCQNLELSPIE